jgi:hypothetical protein
MKQRAASLHISRCYLAKNSFLFYSEDLHIDFRREIGRTFLGYPTNTQIVVLARQFRCLSLGRLHVRGYKLLAQSITEPGSQYERRSSIDYSPENRGEHQAAHQGTYKSIRDS